MLCANCSLDLTGNLGKTCPRCWTIITTPHNQDPNLNRGGSVNQHDFTGQPQHGGHLNMQQPQEGYHGGPPQGGYQQPQGPYGTQPTQGGFPGGPPHGGHHGHGPHGHNMHSPYGMHPAYGYPVRQQPGRTKAIVSLVLGILTIALPIPVVAIILGVVGIVLANASKNDGYIGGLRTAAFVISIIGTIVAFFYTISFFIVFNQGF